ncbi:hypothetical protein HDU83_008621 [Entophlyctis luteolus]|nr:hypothetical protein HDU83_008621 [Entophlyctis luteolus]
MLAALAAFDHAPAATAAASDARPPPRPLHFPYALSVLPDPSQASLPLHSFVKAAQSRPSIWAAIIDTAASAFARSDASASVESLPPAVRFTAELRSSVFRVVRSAGMTFENVLVAAVFLLVDFLEGKPLLKRSKRLLLQDTPLDFNMCAIKAFAWHPLKPVVAVLHRQDAVYVYDLRKGFVGKNQGILLNANMDGASCLQWMPLSGNTLAVGCSTGVCVWKLFLDQPADATRFPYAATFQPDAAIMASSTHLVRTTSNAPESSNPPETPAPQKHLSQPQYPRQNQQISVFGQSFMIHHIRHPQLENVSSVCYSPDSSLLFVGCTTTPSVFVVDNSIGEVVAVCRKIVGKGTKSLSVSKDGKYLVQICRSKFLRLWNTATMESVDLETTGPNFRDACFMPDSKTLLIAVDSDGTVTGSTGCVSALQLAGNGGLGWIGGTIKSIALDSKGERLAVTFGNPFIHVQEFACGRDLVFLFDVKLAPHLVLSEIGQLTGPEWDTSTDSTQAPPRLPRGSAVTEPAIVAGPRPMAFAFASNVGGIVKDRQPLLAIAWENGDLEFKVLQ